MVVSYWDGFINKHWWLQLGYLLHLGWKNCYSSCSGVWNMSMWELEGEKALVAPPRWSGGGSMLWGVRHVRWQSQVQASVSVPKLLICLSRSYLGQNSKLRYVFFFFFFLTGPMFLLRGHTGGAGASLNWNRVNLHPLDPLGVQFLAQKYLSSVLAPQPPAILPNG